LKLTFGGLAGAIKTVGQERGRPRPHVAGGASTSADEGVRAPVLLAFLAADFSRTSSWALSCRFFSFLVPFWQIQRQTIYGP